MDIEINRQNFRELRLVERPAASVGEGQVRFTLDAFGITANNVTYAVIGDMLRYWEFFPVAEDPAAWGHVPVWGYATATESRCDEVPEGTRVFGYWPMASELVVRPGRVDAEGFSDITEHRESLPSVYNRYATTAGDRMYDAAREDAAILLRPLFVTSFTIDDFVEDNDRFGASTMVISSASSKTAIGAAFLMAQHEGVEVVGLTSEANRAFVESLGCYHRTLTYDQVGELSNARSVYVDVAGRRDVTRAVHEQLGDQLAYSMVVGDTHWEAEGNDGGQLVGPRPELLFAPSQIAKRRAEWGRDGFEERVERSWHAFTTFSDGWLRVSHVAGAEGIRETFLKVLEGQVEPTEAHVCSF